MPYQSWTGLLNGGAPQVTGAGTALTTATTAAISPQSALASTDYAVVQAPGQPNGWYPGLVLRVEGRGYLTTTTTSTTATIFLRANRLNNGNAYVTLATPVGITTGATAITGIQWAVEALIRCTAIGTASTVSTQGEIRLGNNLAALPANPVALSASPPPGMTLPMPNASGETVASVDTTVLQGIQLAGTLAAATATIQCTEWVVEALD